MSLQSLQLEFAEAINSGELHMESILPVQNMQIYQNNILINLLQTLHQTYPLVEKLVGKDFFHVAAKEYIRRYPSRSGNLYEYGEYFSDFLSEYGPVKELIYLAEVAQFEWLCHTLNIAGEHPGLDINILNRVAPEHYDQIYFVLHPACCIKKFYYPILRVVELCKSEIDEDLELGEEGIHLLIQRSDGELSFAALSPVDFAFLSSLAEGKSLAAALEEAHILDENFVLEKKLHEWVESRVIVDCVL